jgi:predicted  nucleic acid-binding Zn-ribbon protein
MTQIHQLYKLQETDVEIREKTKRLKEVMVAQQESKALLAARERVDPAVTNFNHWQGKHNDLSLELKSLRTKAKNSENRLYSGKVTNPKELNDLQKEIESLSRRADVLDEEVLEALLYLEEAETEKTAADEAYAEVLAKWETSVAKYKEEQNVVALRVHKLMQLRKEQASVVDAASLNEYESLAKKKNGMAIARVRVDMCLGCRLTISAIKIKQAKEGEKVYCGGCGRILYPY